MSKGFDAYIFLGDIYSISTWISLIYLRIKNRKTVIWTHGAYGNESVMKKHLYKTFYRLADGILVYENRAKYILQKDFKLRNEVRVVYNSLDYNLQSKIKASILSESRLSKSKYFCFIGGLQKRKNIQVLLDSFIALKKDGLILEYNLVIIGDGVDFNYYSTRYCRSDIVFTGAIYEEQTIANYLYFAEAMISPGHVGLNVIHAFSYGTPVITHFNYVHHAPEFEAITHETGAFFEEGSVDSLSKAIIKWVNTNRDRDITRLACIKIIETYYNPVYQKKVIKNLISEII